jgi:peptidylprolyl isomerase
VILNNCFFPFTFSLCYRLRSNNDWLVASCDINHPGLTIGNEMAIVKEGDTITLHYKGSLDDGTVFDSSEGAQPLTFKVGDNQVIQGFDDGVRGMEVGENRQINIPADQAYGEYYEQLVTVVPRTAFPPEVTPAIGLVFEMELPSGESMPVRILEIEGDDLTLDANHLLAGEALYFDVQLVSIDNE